MNVRKLDYLKMSYPKFQFCLVTSIVSEKFEPQCSYIIVKDVKYDISYSSKPRIAKDLINPLAKTIFHTTFVPRNV